MKRNYRTLFLLAVITSLFGVSVEAGRSRKVAIEGYILINERSVATAVQFAKSGLWDEAKTQLEAITETQPANHIALFDLGVVYERLGKKTQAKALYERALAYRFHDEYVNALARIQGKTGKGAEHLHRLFRCKGECRKGYVYAHAGLWNEAQQFFQNGYTANPKDNRSCFNLAVAYEVLGNRANAEKYCRQAIAVKTHQTFVDFLAYLKQNPPKRAAKPPAEKPAPKARTQPAETAEDLQVIGYMFVKVDAANVRADASEKSGIMATLPRGARVGVLKRVDNWYQIRMHDNREGWIHDSLIGARADEVYSQQPAETTEPEPPVAPAESANDEPEQAPTKVVKRMRIVDTGVKVAVRAEPSLLSDVIHQYGPGDAVDILNEGKSNWVFVNTPNGPGYVLSGYLEPIQ